MSAEEAEHAKEEHAEAEEIMKRFEKLVPGDAALDRELDTLMREIREHVAEEEAEMFPPMRTIFTPDELRDMGKKVRGRQEACAYPPSSVSSRPAAWQQAARPITGLLDRMRDAVSHRGTER